MNISFIEKNDTSRCQVNISGKVETLTLRETNRVDLSADKLSIRDLYADDMKDSHFSVGPTDILNIGTLYGSSIQLSTKPKYRLIKAVLSGEDGRTSTVEEGLGGVQEKIQPR